MSCSLIRPMILDCTPWILRYWVPVELGFWIAVVRGIPDTLSCVPDSKAQDS